MDCVTRQRVIYIACDYLTVNIAWAIFNVFRYATLENAYRNFHSLTDFMSYHQVILGQITVPLMMVCLFALSGFYRRPFFRSRLEDILNTLWTTFAGMLIIYFVALINDKIPERITAYWIMLILWGSLFIFTLSGRFLSSYIARIKVKRGEVTFPTLICGTGKEEQKLAETLNSDISRGIKVYGLIAMPGDNNGIDNAIELKDISKICKRHNITNIILPPSNTDMAATLNTFLLTGCNLLVSPSAHQLLSVRGKIKDVTGEPLLEVTSCPMSDFTATIKRAADIFVSGVSLVILSPIFVLIATVIKLDSNGPAFYTQQRIGKRLRTFKILKFRSMYKDAEPHGPELSHNGDRRITRIGRFLRKYRLDELPQLLNVLRGEMSLVGPRPERPFFVEKIMNRMPNYCLLSQIRPGLTSWGMVKYGYADTVEGMIERMRYDILYLNNISFAVDMKIILHTIFTVLSGRGV